MSFHAGWISLGQSVCCPSFEVMRANRKAVNPLNVVKSNISYSKKIKTYNMCNEL